MANQDDKTYSYDDLVSKMLAYNDAKGELIKFTTLRDSSRAAMDSHQREVDKAEQKVADRKAEVQRIIRNLEK